MHTSHVKPTGGRVFRVDRECYVVYVGSAHHHVRPFLRIGTSPNVPDRIRQFIGTVVITDRLTGDITQEAAAVGTSTPIRPDYTGSHQLLGAIEPFLTARAVSDRSVDALPGRNQEGAFVEFLTDGSLYVVINGHRILDLSKRERDDLHAAYRLERIAQIVESTDARYHTQSLQAPGFLVTADHSLFAFQDGVVEARALRAGGVRALAERLIAPQSLVTFSGPLEPSAFLAWSKWAARRAGSADDQPSIRVLGLKSSSGKLGDLVNVLQAVGLAVDRAATGQHSDELPTPLPAAAGARLGTGRGKQWPQIDQIVLPDDTQWAGDVAPPLVPGVPYRTHRTADWNAAIDDNLAPFIKGEQSAYGKLARLLQSWNDGTLITATFDPAAFCKEVGAQLSAAPLPVLADIGPTDAGYALRFSIQEGCSIGNATDNRRAIERIAAVAAVDSAEDELFDSERRRLVGFLDDLLQQRRATLRKDPDTKNQAPDSNDTVAADQNAAEQPIDAAAQVQADTAGSSGAKPTSPAAARGRSAMRGGAGAAAPRSAPRNRRRLPVAAALLALLLLVGVTAYLVMREPGGRFSSPDLADSSTQPLRSDDRATAPGAAESSSQSSDPSDPAAATLDSDAEAPPSGAVVPDLPSAVAGIEIDVLDVLLLANRIAQLNDYAPIGTTPIGAADPDWIFPSSVFTLLDEHRYEVIRGDTIWGIARQILDRSLERERAQLADILQRIESGQRPIDELEALIETSHIESVRREARELIQQLRT